MSTRIVFTPHRLGDIAESSRLTLLFGNKESMPNTLREAFPQFHFVVLKQIHSSVVVESDGKSATDSIEADAHITKDRGVALCVRSADYVPLLIHDAQTGWIAGIHAGWRGVENEIVRRTCELLKSKSVALENAQVWIGPHIRRQSFEVGKDVAAQLERRYQDVKGEGSCVIAHSDSTKAYVDLTLIVRAQLAAHGVQAANISELLIDTVTSSDHASFRRDGKTAGRQLSFIALNK